MITKTLNHLTIVTIILNLAVIAALRAGEPLRGPLPASQRQIIQYMADHHQELSRQVTVTDDGYTATTTTENAELAAKMKDHVSYMKKRLDSGAMVRHWDPAFAEMVAYHDQLVATIEPLENGLRVTVSGKTPEAVKVARNHATVVTDFADRGIDAVNAEHAAANTPEATAADDAGAQTDSPSTVQPSQVTAVCPRCNGCGRRGPGMGARGMRGMRGMRGCRMAPAPETAAPTP